MVGPDKDPAPLAELAQHCLAARELIDAIGDGVMRAAIDLLLREVGRALAEPGEPEAAIEA